MTYKSHLTIYLLVLSLILTACGTFSVDGWKGPATDHFDGEQFHNLDTVRDKNSIFDFLKWVITRSQGEWPGYINIPTAKNLPEIVYENELQVTFIGHASILLQTDGVNILTDPVMSDMIGPLGWIGAERNMNPGINFEDLPPVNLVMISHNHYDHMDIPTIKKLYDAFKPVFIVPLGCKEILENEGIGNIIELDWWQDYIYNYSGMGIKKSLKVTAVPSNHFSMRGLEDRNNTLWAGYYIHSSVGGLYFAGDTAFGSHFQKIREKYGKPRFSMLPIGPNEPGWFMKPIHTSSEDAVDAHKILGSQLTMFMHYGMMQKGGDSFLSPQERVIDKIKSEKMDPSQFRLLFPGKSLIIKK